MSLNSRMAKALAEVTLRQLRLEEDDPKQPAALAQPPKRRRSFISRWLSVEEMQALTLPVCLALCFLNCLILAVSFLALEGNRSLRQELNELTKRIAVLEAGPMPPAQRPLAKEAK